jgi:hypothetical protein
LEQLPSAQQADLLLQVPQQSPFGGADAQETKAIATPAERRMKSFFILLVWDFSRRRLTGPKGIATFRQRQSQKKQH